MHKRRECEKSLLRLMNRDVIDDETKNFKVFEAWGLSGKGMGIWCEVIGLGFEFVNCVCQ